MLELVGKMWFTAKIKINNAYNLACYQRPIIFGDTWKKLSVLPPHGKMAANFRILEVEIGSHIFL